jgi:hypothetical protein
MNFARLQPVFAPDGAGGGGASGAASAPSGGGALSAAGGAGGAAAGSAAAGAAAGAAGAGGSGVAAAGGPIGAGGAAEGSGGWKAPDFLPEHLRGADPLETLSKTASDWKAMRDRVASMPTPGKAEADYVFKPGEKAAPFLGNLANDPAVAVAQKAALAAKLSPQQFGEFTTAFYDMLAESGTLAKPYSAAEEVAKLAGPEHRFSTLEQQQAAIAPMLNEAFEFVQGLRRTNVLDDGARDALLRQLDTADGARLVSSLAKAFSAQGARGLALGGQAQPAGGGVSKDGLRAAMRDPRFDSDPAYRAKVQADYRNFYG